MQPLENLIFAFLARQVVDPRCALLARRERLWLLLAQEVFFLAEAVVAATGAVVGWGGRGRA